MQRLFFLISLTLGILTTTSLNLSAQEQAPSYQSLISNGDKEFNNQEYIKAKSYYQEALRIKKDDPTAKSKLNKTLQKIREQSEKEEVFYQYIDEADTYYDDGEYQKSIETYRKAKSLFPKDEYVNERIRIVSQIISDEKDKIASFNEIIKTADDFMSQNKFTEAVLQYKAALELYPNHTTTNDKYNTAKTKKEEYDSKRTNFEELKKEGNDLALRKKYAEAIAKYEAALAIFPDDSDLKEIIEIQRNKKDISDRYNTKINEAENLYLEKSYEKAKNLYKEALEIISDDPYSTDMINRIDETLNSSEYQSLKSYLSLIEEAKTLENNNDIDAALNKYKAAQRANPGDEFSTQKIDYLTNIINDRNKEIELNAQYNTLVKNGDNSITKEDYYTALDYYTRAYELIPSKTEAKEKRDNTQAKIKEIEAQLALEKQKWEEYYATAMSAAQVFMNDKNYTEAIKEYNKALRYKENDPIATQGLNEATQLNEAKLAAISAEYNQYISNGDIQFEGKNYDKAIEYYTKALALDTGYSYPSEMIDRISTILQENKLEQLVSNSIQISSNQTKRFTFNPIDVATRKNNYILIKAKNLSDNAYTMFISYGSSKGNNGSLIIRIPNNQDVNDFIIRIGAQYKWFSEDNTWIELTPENGDIEIELMEITKGN
ncbi:MAG: tetratricopeptide repeat protein [Bacteroidales bacterium]|nr:tetratricopeptide repeat protein [Bacteroidales bacterium]